MNDRIRELAEQAQNAYWADAQNFYESNYKDYMMAKFAELIVRECVGVVEGGSFLHDQAPTAIFAKECSGAIKRHFGVDE